MKFLTHFFVLMLLSLTAAVVEAGRSRPLTEEEQGGTILDIQKRSSVVHDPRGMRELFRRRSNSNPKE
jgi:hypothetical protein